MDVQIRASSKEQESLPNEVCAGLFQAVCAGVSTYSMKCDIHARTNLDNYSPLPNSYLFTGNKNIMSIVDSRMSFGRKRRKR